MKNVFRAASLKLRVATWFSHRLVCEHEVYINSIYLKCNKKGKKFQQICLAFLSLCLFLAISAFCFERRRSQSAPFLIKFPKNNVKPHCGSLKRRKCVNLRIKIIYEAPTLWWEKCQSSCGRRRVKRLWMRRQSISNFLWLCYLCMINDCNQKKSLAVLNPSSVHQKRKLTRKSWHKFWTLALFVVAREESPTFFSDFTINRVQSFPSNRGQQRKTNWRSVQKTGPAIGTMVKTIEKQSRINGN